MPTDDTNGRVTMAVLATKLDYLRCSVDNLTERFELQFEQAQKRDERLGKVEHTLSVVTWVGGAVAAILITVAGAWAKQLLGL